MWIVHIDSWYNSDPEKIIDLIPKDILEYVVFNISMNPSWSEEEQRFDAVEYGYETAKSWLRVCAERGVWAMVQPAAGGLSFFEDYDPAVTDYEDTVYAEFFRDYPNFIGFNYCKQFWGFDNYLKGISVTADERYRHFAGLLKLCNKYGGYLIDSWCGNQWTQAINPLAMIKRIPEFEQAARLYSDNFILLEKFTSTQYIADMESLVFGTYLSGYCGNFGIRYDSSGWTDEQGIGQGHETPGYSLVTGLPVHLERMLLNGATVIDGPELTFVDDFLEIAPSTDNMGYSSREWETTLQFRNVFIDMYRKFLDGSLKIPTREEVIKRTKLIIVNDIDSGSDDDKYSIPETLTEGLYRMEGDGDFQNNHNLFKSTGRYPTIPITAGFASDKFKEQFESIIYKSEYMEKWGSVEAKVSDINMMFSEEYTGNLYAGRYLNTWVVYNPYKRNQTAKSTLNLKYNTADAISLECPRYSVGVISEFEDRIDIYLNNYVPEASPQSDIIRISGASERPTYKLTDRGDGTSKPLVTEDWSDGIYKLTVTHNGPIDITISCAGTGTGRLTELKKSSLNEPKAPAVYHGQLQHEGEFFDTLDVEQVVKDGARGRVREYRGQGYLLMGMNKGACGRDTVTVPTGGIYTMKVRCRAGGGETDVYVNGRKSGSITLSDTNGGWVEFPIEISLKDGKNTVEFRINKDLPSKLYIDCFTLDFVRENKSMLAGKTALIAAAAFTVITVSALLAAKVRKHSCKRIEKNK